VWFVVEVMLTAEEQHLVLRERLIDQGRGVGVEFTKSNPVDARADVLTQLHHTEIAAHVRPFEAFTV
jgi:hypothetical protein